MKTLPKKYATRFATIYRETHPKPQERHHDATLHIHQVPYARRVLDARMTAWR